MAASGQFSYVTGDVLVESQGRRVQAVRGTEVNPGDLVITGANGMAQLAMIDQAKLSLRVNSQLRIERYQRAAADTDGAILSLLRGTLRDHVTQRRRPFVRFFACEEDLSHELPDAPLPEAVATGVEPYLVVGAVAGG